MVGIQILFFYALLLGMGKNMFNILVSILGSAIIGILGWIFTKAENLATRVTILETQQKPLLDLINNRFDAIEDRLDRIEHKQDKV